MEEKKYYIQPMRPDWYRWEDYYDPDSLERDLIWVGGNIDYQYLNDELMTPVVEHLAQAYEDAENELYRADYFEDDPDAANKTAKIMVDMIKYYFKKHDNTPFKNSEISKLVAAMIKYNEDADTKAEELQILCEVLGILYNKHFNFTTFRGYSQGDWMYCIYPDDVEKNIPFLEALLMGTGTEFAISVEKIDPPEDLLAEEVYYDFTEKYTEDDILEWAAKSIGCSKDEIVLLPERK